MGKVFTLDVSTPANSVSPTGGAAIIRLLKNALHERHNQDHYWEKSGDTADVDDVGYHRKATLLVLVASPAAKADAGILYSLDVDAKAELHYRDEDGNVVQITSAGALKVPVFGAWATKNFETSYLADTDGFVVAYARVDSLVVYSDANNPPTTGRIHEYNVGKSHSGSCPVRKGDYWKATSGSEGSLYWLPARV